MAIESVNLTVPGGDTPRSAFTKINNNFSNPVHAASRLVGTGDTDLANAKDTYKAANTRHDGYVVTNSNKDCNDFAYGTRYLVGIGGSNTNTPPFGTGNAFFFIETRYNYTDSTAIQIAWGYQEVCLYVRTKTSSTWSSWKSVGVDKLAYDTTTAAGANAVINSAGSLMRSTSSERYKDIIADLELDDVAYKNAMKLAPIVYRSTADADNPDYHYYSFSAEKLGAYDPAFTLWRETETVTDDEGNVTEQPLDERQAEGLNLNAIVAFLHATNIKQGKLIKDLQDQVNALKPVST